MEQEHSLDLYLEEMFEWYEQYEPTTVGEVKRLRFEDKLAWYGLDLGDLTFNEIIKGDLQTILEVRGLKPCNNKDYNNYGGVA
jgi:hypothetical protein